jgi:hypothetical protein
MPGSWDGKSRPSTKQYRENYDAIFKKESCPCGRSPTGKCIGWHRFSESEYKVKLAEWNEKNSV